MPLGLQPQEEGEDSLHSRSTPLPSGVSSAQPTLRPAVALTGPKRNQGGPVPTPSYPGHPMNTALLLPQVRGPDARVSSCGDRESQGLLLEAGPGPEGGEQTQNVKDTNVRKHQKNPVIKIITISVQYFLKSKLRQKSMMNKIPRF